MSTYHTDTLAVIREFHTARFSVIVDAIEDCDPVDVDDDGLTAERVANGELVQFCARVRVLLDGDEVAAEYLGACIYENPEDFQDHRACAGETRKLRAAGSDAVVGSYFADMVRSAIKAARQHIRETSRPYIRSTAP